MDSGEQGWAPRDGHLVPHALRVIAAWSWRLLLVIALSWVVLWLAAQVLSVVVALVVALLGTALLQPAVARLRGAGVPDALATGVVLVSAAAIALWVVYLIVTAVLAQADELAAAVGAGIRSVADELARRLGTPAEGLLGQLGGEWAPMLGGSGGSLPGAVFGVAATAVEVTTGAAMALFAMVFFVHDGPRMWRGVVARLPERTAGHLRVVGPRAWEVMSAYARGTLIVAAIDGIGIGVGVALVGVPLALPIGVLVFLASFVPVVGALVSGLVAVLIALATLGPTEALLVLGIVIAVQQIEGQVLQPLIQSNLVALHPLLIVLAVTVGSLTAGVAGAVIAVPLVAVARTVVTYWLGVDAAEPAVGRAVGAPIAQVPTPLPGLQADG